MSTKLFASSSMLQEAAAGEATEPSVPPPAEDAQAEKSENAEPAQAPGKMAELAGVLNNHKGKLAVGAAAMLGVAIFYKWRESRLAKEDPEEYARLKRLKKAIGDNDDLPAEAAPPDKPE